MVWSVGPSWLVRLPTYGKPGSVASVLGSVEVGRSEGGTSAGGGLSNSPAEGSAGEGSDAAASKRIVRASTTRSTIFLALDPSGSLSGLYWAMSRPRRFLCAA